MPRLSLLLLGLLLMLVPAGTAHAADVFETYTVPTVDGGKISVEVARPEGATNVPIILTYSPYNTLNDPALPGSNIADDRLYGEFGPKGYARAYADVLGTRNSTGCWDYGGPKEQQSGVDVVNFLAKQPWSNGRVGMIGGSYDGTTANMVAVRGEDAPGLAAIVPQVAIGRWYGYAYQDGVRYFLNSQVPTDEGFDTPLLFDFGFGRTPPNRLDPQSLEALQARLNPCDADVHTAKAYDRTPDYDDFWLQRDYTKDGARVRVPALVTHGWQDYNVKQSEGIDFFASLTNAPWKKLFVYQGSHGTPDHEEYATLLQRFFARTLKGEENGIEREPSVWTEGRTASDVVKLRTEEAWPPPGTRALALPLTRSGDAGVLGDGAEASGEDEWSDAATTSEELALQDPSAEQSWRWYVTEPLKEDARIAGSAVLDALVKTSEPQGQLSPTLVDVAPDGSTTVIARGHLNTLYRDGLAKAVATPVGEAYRARVRLAPQDHTVLKGHRIGLLAAASNVVWALPSDPADYALVRGQSRLLLPLVGPAPARAVPGAEPAPPSPAVAATGAQPSAKPRATRTAGSRLTLRARRVGSRILVTGRAARARTVVVTLRRSGSRRTVTRRVRLTRSPAFRLAFRGVPRRRSVLVRGRLAGERRVVTRRLRAVR